MKRRHDYSQHFLKNPALVADLIHKSRLTKNDTVIDIGAGSGTITFTLATYVAHVIAIEAEPKTVQTLRRNVAKYNNVEIVEQDVALYELPKTPYSIFANIPFHLSSSIIQKFLLTESHPTASYLILQLQFANKLLASSSNFTSQLGATLAPFYETRIVHSLARTDYMPEPNVDTVLLEILPRKNKLLEWKQLTNYQAFVTKCYEQPAFFGQVQRETKIQLPFAQPARATLEQLLQLFIVRSLLLKQP